MKYGTVADVVSAFSKSTEGIYSTGKGFTTTNIHFSMSLTSINPSNGEPGRDFKNSGSCNPINHKTPFTSTISKADTNNNYEILGIIFFILLALVIFLP